MKRLSERLENIIDMIRPAEVLVDIGCDHGFVCIRAVSEGRCRRAIAADVAEGPLEIARGNIASSGFSDRIECVLSDGFRGLGPEQWCCSGTEPEAAGEGTAFLSDDCFAAAVLPVCVVITGMGGRLIAEILKGAEEKAIRPELFAEIITGAQSEPGFLRHYLIDELGVCIREERCVLDDGRYYMLMDVVPGGTSGILAGSASGGMSGAAGCGVPETTNPGRNLELQEDGAATAPGAAGAEEKSVVTCVDGISGRREAYSEAEYLYGKYIRPADMQVYRDYLELLKGRLESALRSVRAAAAGSSGTFARIKELEDELVLIEGRLADVR